MVSKYAKKSIEFDSEPEIESPFESMKWESLKPESILQIVYLGMETIPASPSLGYDAFDVIQMYNLETEKHITASIPKTLLTCLGKIEPEVGDIIYIKYQGKLKSPINPTYKFHSLQVKASEDKISKEDFEKIMKPVREYKAQFTRKKVPKQTKVDEFKPFDEPVKKSKKVD